MSPRDRPAHHTASGLLRIADVPTDLPRRRHQLELATFLLLVVPGLVLGQVTAASRQTFVLTGVATILNDLALSALVLFFVWSGGESLASIGWTTRRAGREAVLGVLLYLPMLGLLALLGWLLHGLGIGTSGSRPDFLEPRTPAELVLACVLVIVVACAEETIFRGYLLLRLRELTRSTTAAVVIASLLFASGHTYEGVGGVIAVGLMGVVFALVYVWRKSLVAPVVMHFVQDFLGLVIAPWLSTHR